MTLVLGYFSARKNTDSKNNLDYRSCCESKGSIYETLVDVHAAHKEEDESKDEGWEGEKYNKSETDVTVSVVALAFSEDIQDLRSSCIAGQTPWNSRTSVEPVVNGLLSFELSREVLFSQGLSF